MGSSAADTYQKPPIFDTRVGCTNFGSTDTIQQSIVQKVSVSSMHEVGHCHSCKYPREVL